MKMTNESMYQPTDFARRTGVTVRALHFYDRLGLLKPRGRTASGYRFYGDDGFARLQQIVTFKFIGFPLREIKRLLDKKGSNLAISLRAQRRTLEAKREQLGRALKAISKAEDLLNAKKNPGEKAFRKIIETIQMQTNTDWSTQYYNTEAQKLIEERKSLWSPELQKQTEEAYAALFKDIESAAARNLDPTGVEGQALAERHTQLVEAFTGGHGAIREGLTQMWQDQENWPDQVKKQIFEPFAQRGVTAAQSARPALLTSKGQTFLDRALAARK
jgi:MerR family transcriptional regulator, thiopeptide resistance regulator